jgi:hypothetical protein
METYSVYFNFSACFIIYEEKPCPLPVVPFLYAHVVIYFDAYSFHGEFKVLYVFGYTKLFISEKAKWLFVPFPMHARYIIDGYMF